MDKRTLPSRCASKLVELCKTYLHFHIEKKLILLFVSFVGIIILAYEIGYHSNPSVDQLNKLSRKQHKLSIEGCELQKKIRNSTQTLVNNNSNNFAPSSEYEFLRRQISNNIDIFWNSVHYHVDACYKGLSKNQTNLAKILNEIISVTPQQKWYLYNVAKNLDSVDGYSSWRVEESKSLTKLVQARLHYLQNPKDCKNAKKILCRLKDFIYGFGSTFHHIVSCMLISYKLKRTLILDTAGFNYGSWEQHFEPISNTCVSYEDNEVAHWPGNSNSQIIRLPRTTGLNPYPSYLPMAIPSDLKFRIERLHGNPKAWWIGQIATYLFRLNNETDDFIKNYKNKLGFKRPIVGVHVRRTDKKSEAKYYDLKQYMDKVDEYFNQNLHNETDQRSVYLATDEIRLIEEAKVKYAHYKIVTNNETIGEDIRYSTDSLKSLLVDLYFLSNADFLVCTFSSNFCRLAYELMQYKYPDASDRFKSLDRYFHYGGRAEPFTHIAIRNYKSNITEHLELQKGDHIYIEYISENAYSDGMNMRTKKKGIFPTFLVKEHFRSHDYPKYEEVDV